MKLFLFSCVTVIAAAGDWTTFGHDPQRSGWASEETTLDPQNVSQMKLLWKAKVDSAAYSLSALTAPLVLTNLAMGQRVGSAV